MPKNQLASDLAYQNRDQLLNEEFKTNLLELLLAAPEVKPLLSSEHVSENGTLLKIWPSHSSLEHIDSLDDALPPPKGGNELGSSADGGR